MILKLGFNYDEAELLVDDIFFGYEVIRFFNKATADIEYVKMRDVISIMEE